MGQRVYKLKEDLLDLRDKIFNPSFFSHPDHLPEEIDLRPKCSPVFDQGTLGSCTANALAGLREFIILQNGQPLTLLSRLWMYYEERSAEGTISDDAGGYLRDGMKVIQQIGFAPESDWVYDVSKFAEAPPPICSQDAGKFKINGYHRVVNLNLLKASLAEGTPVAIGISVYESFESDETAKTGIIPMPMENEQCLGGHAVLAVGYKTLNGINYVIGRNSWGPDWGDKGYFYLPESYFDRNVSDMWTVK